MLWTRCRLPFVLVVDTWQDGRKRIGVERVQASAFLRPRSRKSLLKPVCIRQSRLNSMEDRDAPCDTKRVALLHRRLSLVRPTFASFVSDVQEPPERSSVPQRFFGSENRRTLCLSPQDRRAGAGRAHMPVRSLIDGEAARS